MSATPTNRGTQLGLLHSLVLYTGARSHGERTEKQHDWPVLMASR